MQWFAAERSIFRQHKRRSPRTGLQPTNCMSENLRARNGFATDAEQGFASDYTRLMHANQKLTPIVAGRVVSGVRQEGEAFYLDFSDGPTPAHHACGSRICRRGPG